MPWINADEERGLHEKIAGLEAELADKNRFIQASQGVVEIAMGELQQMGGGIDETAETIAVTAVVREERARLEAETTARLLREHGEDYRLRFRTDEGPTILAELKEQYRADGTFASIEEQEEAAVRASLGAQVADEFRLAERDRLDGPEAREAIKELMKRELEASGEAAKITDEVRDEKVQLWSDEVRAVLRAEAEERILAEEAEYKERARGQLAESREIKEYSNDTLATHQERWNAALLEELREAAFTDAERKAIQKRIDQVAQEARDFEEQSNIEKLLKDFETLGIDMDKIAAGKKVEIILGSTKNFSLTRKVPNKDSYSHQRYVDEQYEELGIEKTRLISLTSLGGGRFSVDIDSLNGSASPHEKAASLPKGTVIVIGRKLHENGEALFEHKLVAEHNLIYDDNTTNDEVIDSLATVVNVSIDGQKARPITHVVAV